MTKPTSKSKPSAVAGLIMPVVFFGCVILAVTIIGPAAGRTPGLPRLLVMGTAGLLFIGLIALWLTYLYFRSRRTPEERAILAQVDAQSTEEAKHSSLAALENTGYFTQSPPVGSPDPAWPVHIQDLFRHFERLEFYFAGNPKPFFVLDRGQVQPLQNCKGVFRIGALSTLSFIVAIDASSGRTFLCVQDLKEKDKAGWLTRPNASWNSPWHYLTHVTAQRRVSELRKAQKTSCLVTR